MTALLAQLQDPATVALLAGAFSAFALQIAKRRGWVGSAEETVWANRLRALAATTILTLAGYAAGHASWDVREMATTLLTAWLAAGGVWATTLRAACPTATEEAAK
jgi:hypothetical protein